MLDKTALLPNVSGTQQHTERQSPDSQQEPGCIGIVSQPSITAKDPAAVTPGIASSIITAETIATDKVLLMFISLFQ